MRIGCDRSTISRWESGATAVPDGQLRVVLDVLGFPGVQFGRARTGDAHTSPTVPAEGHTDMRRRAFLLAAGAAALGAGQSQTDASAAPSASDLLHRRLADVLLHPDDSAPLEAGRLPGLLSLARRDYRTARYLDLSVRLRSAVATVEHLAADDPSPAGQALRAATYTAVARALFKLPASGLEWIAVDRALRSAREAEDPLLLAQVRAVLATAHRREKRHATALAECCDTADAMIASGLHLTGTTTVEILCAGAYAAAKDGDRDRALELLAEAKAMAGHVRNDRRHWTAVDPATNIEIYRVSIGTALYEPGIALGGIRAVALDSLPTTERKARFLVDAAAARVSADQLDLAARTLLLAHRVAPQEVSGRAAARSIATTVRRLRPEFTAPLRAIGL